jgi:hypothetical protein
MAGGWFRPWCRGRRGAAVGIAASPQPISGSRTQHLIFTGIGAAAIAVWPALAAQRRAPASILVSPRVSASRVPGVPDLALLDRRRDPQRCGSPPGRTGEYRDPDWLAARRRRRRQPARHRADDRHRARCQPKLAVLLFTQLQTEGWAADAQAHAPRLRPRRPVDADAAPVRGAVPQDLGLATMACRGRRRTRRSQAGRPRLTAPPVPGPPADHHSRPDIGTADDRSRPAAGASRPDISGAVRRDRGKPCPAQGRAPHGR